MLPNTVFKESKLRSHMEVRKRMAEHVVKLASGETINRTGQDWVCVYINLDIWVPFGTGCSHDATRFVLLHIDEWGDQALHSAAHK
eukprot:37062-Eustigmatos_ZCMA.PRE.1